MPDSPSLPVLSKPLILVGLMGAGKTSIGRRLAEQLQLAFFDSDVEIEREQGRAIREIFASEGEPHFRALELAKIRQLLTASPQTLIAAGGGAFVQPATHDFIKQHALSIWLKAADELLIKRLEHDTARPLLGGDLKSRITTLSTQRNPIYATADITVELPDEPLAASCQRVLNEVREFLS